jgi:hypothetical protein
LLFAGIATGVLTNTFIFIILGVGRGKVCNEREEKKSELKSSLKGKVCEMNYWFN